MEERPHLYIIPIHFDERDEVAATRYWVGIFRYLKSLPPDLLARLQVYQDGLVNAPAEIVDKIVEETQTANYEILRWLREKGATIFGTEDASLLSEECDKYIAKRIRETLSWGRTGLLFIDAAHYVDSLLGNEFLVSTPEIVSHAFRRYYEATIALERREDEPSS